MPIDANTLIPSLWATLQQPAPTNTWPLGGPQLAWSNIYLGGNGTPAFDPISGNIGYFYPTSAEQAAAAALSIPIATFVPQGTYSPGNMLRYGADRTGVGLSDTAWTYANAQAGQSGGAAIAFPGGKFSTAVGFTVTNPGVRVTGAANGLTILQAAANNIWVLKLSQQFDSAADLQISNNGFTNVDGLVLAPANESITSVINLSSYIDVERVFISSGCNNGLRMRGGPSVAGADSQLFYCQFRSVFIQDATRAIWMQNAVNNGNGGPNACSFFGCRASRTSGSCNTGLQIDMGTGNMFFGLHFENINTGTSPSTVPTAIVIANQAASGLGNNDNQFFGTRCEANTQDLNNMNPYTAFYGGQLTQSKFATGGSTVNPLIMLTGEVSIQPLILPGMSYGQGLPGFPSGYWGMTEEIADIGKQWQPYALSTSIVTNVASIGTAVSNYRQLSNVVSWAVTFSFDASVAGTQLTITPPVAPNTAQYTSLGGNNSFYSVWVNNGSGPVQAPAGWLSTGKFYIGSPSGGWNTGGNNNQVFIQVDYHI